MMSAAVQKRFSAPGNLATEQQLAEAQLTGSASSADGRTRIMVALQKEGDVIQSAHFRALGCPWTVAAADLACETLTGAGSAALAQAEASGWATALDIPPERLGRLLVIEDALRNAFEAWENTPLT